MTSPTTTLRTAATRLRELAKAARDGYVPLPQRCDIDHEGTCDSCGEFRLLVASYPEPLEEPWLCGPCAAQADFEGALHPDVALRLADLLDELAGHLSAVATFEGSGYVDAACPDAALALARTFLGEVES